MEQMARKTKSSTIFTYILIAIVVYILYTILFSKPRASFTPEFVPGSGKMPYLPADETSNIEKKTDESSSKHESLTDEQRSQLRDVLQQMERMVHLDLKGAAPKISYLRELFPLFKRMGATGLLIEWEDMFPYYGELEIISAKDCYSKEDVATMLSLAKENDLKVIPLVQTFGHMEFVLKGPKFKHLRENLMNPSVINPHLPESLELVQKMIDQLVELQPDVEFLHIGADEVWVLGEGKESQEKMETYGISKDVMFLNHVREVAGFIKNTYPNIGVMMWDDMFRNANVKDIERSKVNRIVTPVVWKYVVDVDTFFKPDLWMKYSRLFRTIWFGSAFKGATGSDQYITDISYHYENHIGWLKILSKLSSTVHVGGTMITGWQRYDHFAVLAELLPVSIPSLAVCLSTMRKAGVSKSELEHINELLGCRPDAPIQWSLDTRDRPEPKCSFPGHKVFEGVYMVKNAQYYASFLNSKGSLLAWHKEYNLKRDFSHSSRIKFLLEKTSKGYTYVTKAEAIMNSELPKYFSEETHVEWMETNIKPLKDLLQSKIAEAERLLKLDTWPRRPIHNIIN